MCIKSKQYHVSLSCAKQCLRGTLCVMKFACIILKCSGNRTSVWKYIDMKFVSSLVFENMWLGIFSIVSLYYTASEFRKLGIAFEVGVKGSVTGWQMITCMVDWNMSRIFLWILRIWDQYICTLKIKIKWKRMHVLLVVIFMCHSSDFYAAGMHKVCLIRWWLFSSLISVKVLYLPW